jgi:hypothetical protein
MSTDSTKTRRTNVRNKEGLSEKISYWISTHR